MGMALIMVLGDQRGAASVRLVQDLGRPSDPPEALAAAAPAAPDGAPLKRGRGRPPGSRTKKPA
jgi:hypothetical protein